jgi:fibro-slime domain-containing protein
MADTKIIGTAYGWLPWGYDGMGGGPNVDIGALFRNMLPRSYVDVNLDSEGLPKLGGSSGTTVLTAGEGYFNQWFRDAQPAEKIVDVEITLTESGGKYLRAYAEFNHVALGLSNWCYTFKGNTQSFRYIPGQYIKFYHGGSTEDVFIYVNGRRLLEITGGIDTWQTASLDGLGLVEGEFYPIRFFIVYRDPGGSGGYLGVETNFELEADYMVALSQWIIGSGTITPAAGAYEPSTQTITATPGTGYKLSTLTLNGSAIASGSSQSIATHSTIAAIFTRDQKNIHSCTRDEIIAAALRKCQVLAEADLPTNDQISTGAEALERFMQHSQSDCEFRWQFLQRTQAVAADEQTIALTGSEDVLDVYDLFLRDANGMDIPLRLVDAHWYDSTLQYKSTSDALPAVALATFNRDPDTNVASVSLSIYPKPAQAYTLYYRAMIKQYILENGTDEANFDEMWCEVVVYGLAARLADEYNRTERAVYLEQKFEKLKDAAKRKTGASRDSLVVFSV